MPAFFRQDEKQVYTTVTAHSHVFTSLGFFSLFPKHALTQGMAQLGFTSLLMEGVK